MGMYTELVFGARIENDNKIVEIIKDLMSDNPGQVKDDHEFFKCERYTQIMNGTNSYSFTGTSKPTFYYDIISKEWTLQIRCNFKKYDKEIQKFLSWIKPYIKQGSGRNDMYAMVIYEESACPELFYLNPEEE